MVNHLHFYFVIYTVYEMCCSQFVTNLVNNRCEMNFCDLFLLFTFVEILL